MSEGLTYKKALERIQEIVGIIDSNEADIDEMIGLVKEATELIEACKNKLQNAELDLESTLQKLSNS